MSVLARVRRLESLYPEPTPATGYEQYAQRPVEYCKEILKQELWEVQKEIARKLLEPPYRVLVKASHGVGKTHLGGCLTNWWYDTRPVSSAVITTAPTAREVQDLLWREVRVLRKPRGGFLGPASPRLGADEDHYAKGFTASKAPSFQGRHPLNLLFIFDEAVGVDPQTWEGTESMFKPDGHCAWLAIFNPTDSSSQAFQEEQKGGWHSVTMSSLDHPNIAAELAGQSLPYPAAVTLGQVNGWLQKWADPIEAGDAQVTDIEFPPGSGRWLRPGPLAESRVLGRWPSQAAYSVWSDALWQALLAVRHDISPRWPVQIGCDVARFGDDFTAIHLRKGLCSLHHESHNGWDTDQTAGRLKELCCRFADEHNPEKRIPCLVDVGGPGAGVIDQAKGYNFVPVNSSEVGRQPDRYRNLRSELWFSTKELARDQAIDISRLPQAVRQEIGRQLLAPRYTVNERGQQVVDPKDVTKKDLKRSPDDADATNLCYLSMGPVHERVAGHTT